MIDKNKQQTEWELTKNVIYKCKDCWNKEKKTWQKKNKLLKINTGDFVKIPITDKNGTEHLWFEVININENKKCPTCKSDDVYRTDLNPDYNFRCNGCGDYFAEFVGRCDNVPVVIEKLKYDDITNFEFTDIENHIGKDVNTCDGCKKMLETKHYGKYDYCKDCIEEVNRGN